MLKIKGIDISRAQEQFDFTAAVSAGVKFVIIRAGIRRMRTLYFQTQYRAVQNRYRFRLLLVCYGDRHGGA